MEPLDEMFSPIALTKFITINKTESRVEVHLRGHFPEPQFYTNEIIELSELSKVYTTVVVYINSPGGDASAMTELMTILRQFNQVITVATSIIASAGFMIWMMGDLRVIADHAWVMMHRESYSIMEQKTQAHKLLSEYNDKIYSKMIEKYCAFLTQNEIEMSKVTEVYFSSDELIERGVAISWDDFIIGEEKIGDLLSHEVISVENELYAITPEGNLQRLTAFEVGDTFTPIEVFYTKAKEEK